MKAGAQGDMVGGFENLQMSKGGEGVDGLQI